METYTFLVLDYESLSLITQSHLEDTPRLPRVHSLVCTDHWKVWGQYLKTLIGTGLIQDEAEISQNKNTNHQK